MYGSYGDPRADVGIGLQRLDFAETASTSMIHARGPAGVQGATASSSSALRDAPADYAPLDYSRNLQQKPGLKITQPVKLSPQKTNPLFALAVIGISLYLINKAF